jgi:hypothetical protein
LLQLAVHVGTGRTKKSFPGRVSQNSSATEIFQHPSVLDIAVFTKRCRGPQICADLKILQTFTRPDFAATCCARRDRANKQKIPRPCFSKLICNRNISTSVRSGHSHFLTKRWRGPQIWSEKMTSPNTALGQTL